MMMNLRILLGGETRARGLSMLTTDERRALTNIHIKWKKKEAEIKKMRSYGNGLYIYIEVNRGLRFAYEMDG